MDKDYVWVCEKCMEIDYSSSISKSHKCTECGGNLVKTDKDEDEWSELFYKTHPSKTGSNTICREIDDFIAKSVLKNSKTIDNDLVNKRNEELDRLGEYLEQLSSISRCPKCGSTSFHSEKRGFSTGRAVAAGALTGFLDVAAVAGMVGKDKMVNVCNNCGHKWK